MYHDMIGAERQYRLRTSAAEGKPQRAICPQKIGRSRASEKPRKVSSCLYRKAHHRGSASPRQHGTAAKVASTIQQFSYPRAVARGFLSAFWGKIENFAEIIDKNEKRCYNKTTTRVDAAQRLALKVILSKNNRQDYHIVGRLFFCALDCHVIDVKSVHRLRQEHKEQNEFEKVTHNSTSFFGSIRNGP